MPSRQLSPHAPPHNHHQNLFAPLAAAAISFSLLLFLAFLYRKLTLSRTAPAPLSTPDRQTAGKPPEKENEKHLRRFKFSLLKKSTCSFSPENRLGQGGFGSVYRAVIPKTGEVFAVKVMDAIGSIQGEREFQNEIALANRVIYAGGGCRELVKVVGYAAAERRRGERQERKVIVYEFMSNGSLQEKLLDKKCLELCVWEKRRKIIVDVAKALRFLHFNCGSSAVIHGDVKPSNVLLDNEFNAKLGDFGLAKILDDDIRVLIEIDDDNNINNVNGDAGSIVEEEEEEEEEDSVSVVTAEQLGFSRENSLIESVEGGKKKGWGSGSGSGRDYWWWKQGGEDSSSGLAKDYVMEWIGSEINKEIPKTCSDVIVCDKQLHECITKKKKKKKKKNKWWGSLDGDDKSKKKGRKPPREWWREEFCEELSRKNNKSKSKVKTGSVSEMWWQKDDEFVAPERKKRKKSKTSFGSIDWWLDGFSGEIRGAGGGDVPKSGGISSTPSMRGTVCYIAPEYGGGGQLSEKCDVYSFGVLVLVVISGRRPLQVLASPMSEFERANLVSWARQLAHNGRLLDLVDSSIQGLDKEQAMVCITIALLCLQRSPCKRPSMKEIVEMLTGEAEPPHLPFEFSPSPPSNFPFKSRKKGSVSSC